MGEATAHPNNGNRFVMWSKRLKSPPLAVAQDVVGEILHVLAAVACVQGVMSGHALGGLHSFNTRTFSQHTLLQRSLQCRCVLLENILEQLFDIVILK